VCLIGFLLCIVFVCVVCVCVVCVCCVYMHDFLCLWMCVFAVLDASAIIPAHFWPLFTKFFCDLTLILDAFIRVVCLIFIFFCILFINFFHLN